MYVTYVTVAHAGIQEFAIANLHKACQLPEEASDSKPRPERDAVKAEGGGKALGEGGGVEVVRHYMHLFMALCAQRHELLHALIDAYVQASAGVRSAVQASITDMIKAIGAESPVNQSRLV